MKVVRQLDADTFEVSFFVRLHGVQAPEKGQAGYEEANKRAAELAPVGSSVRVLHVLGETSYGRLVAELENKSGVNVGRQLIEEGYAESRPQPVRAPSFPREEVVLNREPRDTVEALFYGLVYFAVGVLFIAMVLALGMGSGEPVCDPDRGCEPRIQLID